MQLHEFEDLPQFERIEKKRSAGKKPAFNKSSNQQSLSKRRHHLSPFQNIDNLPALHDFIDTHQPENALYTQALIQKGYIHDLNAYVYRNLNLKSLKNGEVANELSSHFGTIYAHIFESLAEIWISELKKDPHNLPVGKKSTARIISNTPHQYGSSQKYPEMILVDSTLDIPKVNSFVVVGVRFDSVFRQNQIHALRSFSQNVAGDQVQLRDGISIPEMGTTIKTIEFANDPNIFVVKPKEAPLPMLDSQIDVINAPFSNSFIGMLSRAAIEDIAQANLPT